MKYKYKALLFLLSIAVLCIIHSLARADNASTFHKKEFVESRIKKYSVKELLQYLSLDSVNWQYEKYQIEIPYIIRDELTRRRQIVPLIKAFENPTDKYQQLMVAQSLYGIDDDRIASAFKKYISSEITETMYFCLSYLAKRGDEEALAILNNNYFKYPVSSLQWSTTVIWFGKYKYKPAIPNLIKSLDAASLNLVGAAEESLEQIFEGPHPDFKTIAEMKDYFERLYKENR